MSIGIVRNSSEPNSKRARRLREKLSESVWECRASEAKSRLELLEAVQRRRDDTGLSWLKCLKQVAPKLSWSKYQSWCRRLRAGSGPNWERLLDYRTPPKPVSIPEQVRIAAEFLRQADPKMACETARNHLVRKFGEDGDISDTSLRRIWRDAGLSQTKTQPPATKEEVESFHGGAGLAMIAAAAEASGVPLAMAKAVLESGRVFAESNSTGASPLSAPEERDAWGRFTPNYNRAVRADMAPGDDDPRLATDATKRTQRDLSTLGILGNKPETLALKLLSMGATPLLTERRGFDGLEGPLGGWLGVLGGTAYMPATLDKSLAELALLEANSTLWATHGQKWAEFSRLWSRGGPPWLQMLLYVDATQDPYWTQRYAASAKVSRLGKVMPALSRVAVMAGPGVPLLMVTLAGAVSLKSELVPTLKKLEETVGEGEIGRITVVDAEIASNATLFALASLKNRYFITVLKGAMEKQAKKIQDWQAWSDYRERDKIREGTLILMGEGAPEGGLRLRVVEMRREGRQPKSTLFATTTPEDALKTEDVPTAYLTRWPHQEQRFRDGRNGGGLNRTQGYGGDYVTHVAIETDLEKARKGVERAEARVISANSKLEAAKRLKEALHSETKASRKDLTTAKRSHRELKRSLADETGADNSDKGVIDALAIKEEREQQLEAAKQAVTFAHKTALATGKALEKAKAELAKKETTPRVVYSRDTTREEIGTVLTAMLLMLVEYVLKEYFPKGTRMEWRTFIELFVYLPVTVKTSRTQITYEIEANPRDQMRIAQLRHACSEINRRKIKRKGKRLRFSVLEPGVPRPGPNL